MAQLPPDGNWLIQQIAGDVVLFQRHTEQELVRYPADNASATGDAQKMILESEELTPEAKAFAHFWCGYFYAHADHS